MKAIIPTGGSGTRMRPLTFSSNKHFIPIANKPLIFYPIETVVKAGINDIAITYNPQFLELVKSFLGDGSRWGAKFTYVLQEEPKGLANIFQVCEQYLGGDSFVLHLGDNIFVDGIKDFVDYFEKEKPNGLVAMVHHKENSRMGVPFFDDDGRLIKYVEKPENPPHDFAIPGLYFFDNNVFKCFSGPDPIKPSERGELEISTPFQWLIDHKFRVDVLEYKGRWLDPGKFDDWIEANGYLVKKYAKNDRGSEVDERSKIEGNVQIGKSCLIKNSKFTGPLIVGDNVTIENSEIGPYSSISNGCIITDSKIDNSVLMENVKVLDVKNQISESLIGSESEITNGHNPDSLLSFFIGEKCKIEL